VFRISQRVTVFRDGVNAVPVRDSADGHETVGRRHRRPGHAALNTDGIAVAGKVANHSLQAKMRLAPREPV